MRKISNIDHWKYGKVSKMKVRVDVYTKNVDAALSAFKTAIEDGATNVGLDSSENYETNKFEYLNLSFMAEHTSESISELDNGLFSPDRDEMNNP